SWDGVTWTVRSLPNPGHSRRTYMAGVACSSSTACTAVGAYHRFGDRSHVERYDGVNWTIQPSADAPNGRKTDLTGVSCPASQACVAVGTSGSGDRRKTFVE